MYMHVYYAYTYIIYVTPFQVHEANLASGGWRKRRLAMIVSLS